MAKRAASVLRAVKGPATASKAAAGARTSAGGARSIRQLAATIGVTAPAVLKWLEHPAWRFGRGPWTAQQVEQIRAWRAATLQPDPAKELEGTTGDDLRNLGPERRAKVLRALASAQKTKLETEILAGKYHRIDECERRQVLKVQRVRDALLNVAKVLPLDPASQSADQIRQLIQAEMERICRMFAGQQ